MTVLEESWQRAWHSLALTPASGLCQRLIEAYGQAHRRYHSLQHLRECLDLLPPVRGLATHPGELELAIWFHDAVYDVKGKDNELRSAQWAARELRQSGASPDQAQRVHALIMATCHTATAPDADSQLLVDIDLSILGADPARFAQYDAQIRAEYRWVPGPIYRMKRKSVLRGFLDRPAIYGTPHFWSLYEAQARANLQAALA
ncbi:MAG: N-methyl-D-aspartate receptor NMDAR2C subunit [Rubrivivax sp.]|nr:MAG: N-methyl-D-aspartate receptor NMDAR2C subunit [Rubrivivax sp.]